LSEPNAPAAVPEVAPPLKFKLVFSLNSLLFHEEDADADDVVVEWAEVVGAGSGVTG